MLGPLTLVLTRIAILLGFHKPHSFFNKAEEKEIVEAIVAAEETTSAEIRVHISSQRKIKNIVEAAQQTFNKLGMQKTEERNGILIFIVPESKQFAIWGDVGINSKVLPTAWDDIRNEMQTQFKQQHFKRGVISGISQSAKLLSAHFKPTDTNPNELSNEISTDA